MSNSLDPDLSVLIWIQIVCIGPPVLSLHYQEKDETLMLTYPAWLIKRSNLGNGFSLSLLPYIM